MKSAIGEGMTRKDHADVSNQLVSHITLRGKCQDGMHYYSMQTTQLARMFKQ
jgi:vacuolar-type H+-ATPase subunit B/Vma2